MFSDAVARELFKTADEIDDLEYESAQHKAKNRSRAWMGAGATAAALGAVALGTWALAKPFETVGTGIDNIVKDGEGSIFSSREDKSNTIRGAGLGAGAAIASGAVAGGLTDNSLKNLGDQLMVPVAKADAANQSVRNLLRGMRGAGSNQAELASSIRDTLDPATGLGDKAPAQLGAWLNRVAKGDLKGGLFGTQNSLDAISQRDLNPTGAGTKPVTLLDKLTAAIAPATTTKAKAVALADLAGNTGANAPGSVERAAGVQVHMTLGKFNTRSDELISGFERGEAARNRILSSTTPAAEDLKTYADTEIHRTMLAQVAEQLKTPPDPTKAPKGPVTTISPEELHAKQRAQAETGAKALTLIRDQMRGDFGSRRGAAAFRNTGARMVGGSISGAIVANLSNIWNAAVAE